MHSYFICFNSLMSHLLDFAYICLYYKAFRSFPHSWLNTTGVTSGAGIAYPSGAPEFTSMFSGVRVTRSLVLCVKVLRSLFVPLSIFFSSLCCLSFDLRILITPLVSSDYPFGILDLQILITPLVSSKSSFSIAFLFLCTGDLSHGSIRIAA